MINLLIYGGYHHDYIYSNHLAEGFLDVDNINTFPLLIDNDFRNISKKRNHYLPPIRKIKKYLEQSIVQNKITHIINYNTNHFTCSLIDYLKETYNLKISAYFNDSPFSSHLSKIIYYQNQKKALTKYDFVFVYRNEDKEKIIRKFDFDKSFVKVVPPSCPEKRYLKCFNGSKDFKFDFAFLGHYESDGRLEVIRKLISRGYRCLVLGLKWPANLRNLTYINNSIIQNKNINYVEYLSLLSKAYVNLGFLSSINNDSYTRRYFECPFSNSLFLAYESKVYKELNNNMPNIFFVNTKIPSIQDCVKALYISKESNHYPSQEQKNNFYLKNSISRRVKIFDEFLRI